MADLKVSWLRPSWLEALPWLRVRWRKDRWKPGDFLLEFFLGKQQLGKQKVQKKTQKIGKKMQNQTNTRFCNNKCTKMQLFEKNRFFFIIYNIYIYIVFGIRIYLVVFLLSYRCIRFVFNNFVTCHSCFRYVGGIDIFFEDEDRNSMFFVVWSRFCDSTYVIETWVLVCMHKWLIHQQKSMH